MGLGTAKDDDDYVRPRHDHAVHGGPSSHRAGARSAVPEADRHVIFFRRSLAKFTRGSIDPGGRSWISPPGGEELDNYATRGGRQGPAVAGGARGPASTCTTDEGRVFVSAGVAEPLLRRTWVELRRVVHCPMRFTSYGITRVCARRARWKIAVRNRKPRSEEKKRRRETAGRGRTCTGLRHENERRRNERLRRENAPEAEDRPPREATDRTPSRSGKRPPSPRTDPKGAAGIRAGGPARPTGGRRAVRARPSTVDEHYAASAPAACPDCGGAVEVTRVASHPYQEELPVVRPVVRRFDVEVGHCSQCQRRVQGRHVLQTSDALGAAGVSSVPGSLRWSVELHTEMGVPLAKVAHLLRTTFGLQVTPGGLAHVLQRAACRSAPAYTELCEQVRNAPVDAGRDRLARRRRTPLAMGIHHPGHDGLRRSAPAAGSTTRPRCWGPTERRRAVRDGWAPYRCGRAPDVSESPAPTLQAPPGGLSRQSRPARCRRSCRPASSSAGPLQRGRAERARTGWPQPAAASTWPASVGCDGPPPLDDAERFAAHLANEFPAVFLFVGPLARRHQLARRTGHPAPVVIRKVCGGNRTAATVPTPSRCSPASCAPPANVASTCLR